MLIKNAGPKIEGGEVKQTEIDLGVSLPESYREFLLRHNGGTPTPDVIDVLGLAGSPTDVQVFFGIRRNIESSSLAWNSAELHACCPGLQAVPIACDSGGNLFAFMLNGEVATKVVYIDMADPECSTYDVAESFDEFVGMLRPL